MSTRCHRLFAAAAAVAASGGVCAQASIASIDPEEQLLEEIAQLQADGSPSPALVEPLRALGFLYQEAGNHALAIAALEEARHVTRVHQGLASLDEALLLKQQIRSEEALGLHERVWNLEQDMVTMARQHLDDIRGLPIFSELGDDRLDVLRNYHGGAFSPEIYLGCYYAAGLPRYDDTRGDRRPTGEGSCESGSKRGAMRRIHTDILMYYADAIEVIVRNGDYASPTLRDLERQALRIGWYAVPYPWLPSTGNAVTKDGIVRRAQGRCTVDTLDELLALEILGTCLTPIIHVNGVVIANVGGWISLVRLLSYETRSGASAGARANALAELADWILFSTPAGRRRFDASSQRALELYERLYRDLQRDEDLRAATTQFFSPEVPVALPTFAPNPFASAATAQSPRYVDLAFAVTRYGLADQIEILAASKDVTRAEQRDVIGLIEGTTFRPRIVDGKLPASAPVVLRYHLTPRSLQDAREVGLPLCERERVCRP